MPSRGRSRRLAIVASSLFGLVLILGLTIPAQASGTQTTQISIRYQGIIRGYSKFYSYGDKFKVCDQKSDGLSVGTRYGYIRKDGTHQNGSHWVGGAGTCRTFDHDFGEGRNVWFQTCVKRGSTLLGCTDVVTVTA